VRPTVLEGRRLWRRPLGFRRIFRPAWAGGTVPGLCQAGRSRLAARGESPASHRDGRGAPEARRDDREYREYLREEQRSLRGCIARRMQLDFHHGLLGLASLEVLTKELCRQHFRLTDTIDSRA